ncbi:MAG TPA: hypothetical protein GX011_04105 [Clostridiales bacterium]|jgi:hypothetical protein|nr:hypothetical protein [Clostridiales bacterium]
MTVEPLALLRMFIVSLLSGIALEVLWECLGFVGFALRYRRQGGAVTFGDTPISLIVIFVKDVLFFTVAGAVVAVLIYWANDGQFRMLSPVGALLGFYICRSTLGRLLRRLNEELVKLLFAALRILFWPAKKLGLLVMSLICRGAVLLRRQRMKRYTQRRIRATNIIKIHGMPE